MTLKRKRSSKSGVGFWNPAYRHRHLPQDGLWNSRLHTIVDFVRDLVHAGVEKLHTDPDIALNDSQRWYLVKSLADGSNESSLLYSKLSPCYHWPSIYRGSLPMFLRGRHIQWRMLQITYFDNCQRLGQRDSHPYYKDSWNAGIVFGVTLELISACALLGYTVALTPFSNYTSIISN